MKKIRIIRYGNRLIVDTVDSKILFHLKSVLRMEKRKFLYGYARKVAEDEGRGPIEIELVDMFAIDFKGRIVTPIGCYRWIAKKLKDLKVEFEIEDVTVYKRPEAYVPHWNVIEEFGIKFKHKQKQVLDIIDKYANGRIDCPPGFGKSFLIGVASLVFKKAKIIITTHSESVIMRIYNELATMVPGLGLVTGKSKLFGSRVTCVTAGSLHRMPEDVDFVFYDECHEAGAPSLQEKLVRFKFAKMFGFSATQDMRLDNADMAVHALFGPVRLRVSIQEAVDHGMIVPTIVQWGNVYMDEDPLMGVRNSTEKYRRGYWQCRKRNQVIADDARSYGDDVQLLITTATLEHALALKRELPDYPLIYAPKVLNDIDRKFFKKCGILGEDFQDLTHERKAKLTERFTKGKLKRAIVTTVWNRGVDFRQLGVLLRADGGASPINDGQIPGRTYRTHDGKVYGVVHDYCDQHSSWTKSRAQKRGQSYERSGLQQLRPNQRSSLMAYLAGEM